MGVWVLKMDVRKAFRLRTSENIVCDNEETERDDRANDAVENEEERSNCRLGSCLAFRDATREHRANSLPDRAKVIPMFF